MTRDMYSSFIESRMHRSSVGVRWNIPPLRGLSLYWFGIYKHCAPPGLERASRNDWQQRIAYVSPNLVTTTFRQHMMTRPKPVP